MTAEKPVLVLYSLLHFGQSDLLTDALSLHFLSLGERERNASNVRTTCVHARARDQEEKERTKKVKVLRPHITFEAFCLGFLTRRFYPRYFLDTSDVSPHLLIEN